MNTGELIADLMRKPEFASLVTNFLVAVISLMLAYRRRSLAGDVWQARRQKRGDRDQQRGGNQRAAILERQETEDSVPLSHLPAWLGACAGFHLLSTLLFAFNLLQAAWVISAQPSGDATVPGGQMLLLLFLCILIGLSALSLANLTERLSLREGQRVSLPILPAAIGLVLFEGGIFALKQPNFCYLVSEGAWLLACILMTAGLLRLQRGSWLGATGRLVALLTAIGFFGRALIALLFLANFASVFLLSKTGYHLADLGGLIGAALLALPLLKTICIIWTGVGLLLLALTWRAL